MKQTLATLALLTMTALALPAPAHAGGRDKAELAVGSAFSGGSFGTLSDAALGDVAAPAGPLLVPAVNTIQWAEPHPWFEPWAVERRYPKHREPDVAAILAQLGLGRGETSPAAIRQGLATLLQARSNSVSGPATAGLQGPVASAQFEMLTIRIARELSLDRQPVAASGLSINGP